MVSADGRGPASRIPLHQMQCFPAPGTVRYAHEYWPEIPREQCQMESQQETGQGEQDDELESGHILLYLLYQAEGMLCAMMA